MSHTARCSAQPIQVEPSPPIVLNSSEEVPERPTPRAAVAVTLTDVEHVVLRWLAAGLSNAKIGQRLCRSEKTVRNQLTRIYCKLGVANRAAAVAAHMRMEFKRDR